MGMFTTVMVGRVNPKDPEFEVQFKSGDDNCDTYRVGDEVNWLVNKNYVGSCCLLDDVYHGESGDYAKDEPHKDWWVCIKDHRIVHVVEWDRHTDHGPEELRDPWMVQRYSLYLRYSIPTEHPRELWTESAWATHDEAQILYEEKALRSRAAGIDPINAWTREVMRRPGFLRQILPGYGEPETYERKDGVTLTKGETYDHFGRPVVLERIYDNDNLGVKHPKGTHCLVSPEELHELEAVT